MSTYEDNKKKYGTLPEKVAETEPWEVLCIELIGTYTIHQPNGKVQKLWCVTMIDPATGWLEIAQYNNKRPITVANEVEQTWLTRYPRPDICTIDRGSEFIGR